MDFLFQLDFYLSFSLKWYWARSRAVLSTAPTPPVYWFIVMRKRKENMEAFIFTPNLIHNNPAHLKKKRKKRKLPNNEQ
jgi:hypothetical protein